MRTLLSKESIILLSAPLLIIGGCYYPVIEDPRLYFISAWMYLFIIPIFIILFLQIKLKTFGFTWKKWPFQKGKTIVGLLFLIILMYGASLLPQYSSYYKDFTPMGSLLFHSTVVLGSYYFAEEFFFRGFLLFGLKERFGEFSIILQTIPFALFHVGKPPLEAIFSVLAGIAFGYIAYRSDSFIPVFLIHWLMGLLTVAFIAF